MANALGLSRDERHAIREAGLRPSDLAHLTARDVLAATDELIAMERAEGIVALAGIVGCGVNSSIAQTMLDHGIRDREDLASRSADDMFVYILDTTSRTHPHFYDLFAQAVYLAGTDEPEPRRRRLGHWIREREARGFDPFLMYWRRRYGDDAALPQPTGARLRLPTIKVTAPIHAAGVDDRGELFIPLGQKDVVTHDDGSPRLLLGHWMWRGKHGAFAHLERLDQGDGVRVGDDWFMVTSVEKVAAPATVETDGDGDGEVVLATPPHRRVAVIGTEEMLQGVEQGVLQLVVRAESCDESDANTSARPIPPIRGAY